LDRHLNIEDFGKLMRIASANHCVYNQQFCTGFSNLLFSPSEESRAAAHRCWERVNSRPDREPAVSEATIKAQVTALIAWSQGNGSAFPRLGEIKQPVLVANGNQYPETFSRHVLEFLK
jgi:hypothetical protein